MLGGTFRFICTIESYRRSASGGHAYGFVWRYRAIKDIAQISSYRDAIGAPCIRALRSNAGYEGETSESFRVPDYSIRSGDLANEKT